MTKIRIKNLFCFVWDALGGENIQAGKSYTEFKRLFGDKKRKYSKETLIGKVFLFLFVFYVFVAHLCWWHEKDDRHTVCFSSLSRRSS